jgi:hypothetical protein
VAKIGTTVEAAFLGNLGYVQFAFAEQFLGVLDAPDEDVF